MWILLIVERRGLVHGVGGKGCCCCLLLPVEAGSLDRGLTGVAELLLPSWVDLISILLEREEGALELLVGLGILDDTIGQRHLTVGAGLPLLPSILTLAARDRALLRTI